GSGGGAFGAPQVVSFPYPGIPADAAPVFLRDVDGDGHLDIVSPLIAPAGPGVRLGPGAGPVAPVPSSPGAPTNIASAVLADADGDGLDDLLFAVGAAPGDH